MRQQSEVAQQIQRRTMPQSSVARMPFAPIAEFLTAQDVARLASSCAYYYEQCKPDGKLLCVHLTTPKGDMEIHEARDLLSALALPLIKSVHIDAKRKAGKSLMIALSELASNFNLLETVQINAAAESGSFLASVLSFSESIRPNQLVNVHLSGFRTLANIASFLHAHTESILSLKVDYFVNGHETDITPALLPVMPNLTSLVYDVADVVDLPIDVILSVLNGIKNKAAVSSIYLPHMQICGDSLKSRELIAVVKKFENATQLVIRFRRLPLGVAEIVALREAFVSLPAVCISDHFIVMLNTWASWWPAQTTIWESADKISGLSVFREQIDFESLGTSATREWLKLSKAQKDLWSRAIADKVSELYNAH